MNRLYYLSLTLTTILLFHSTSWGQIVPIFEDDFDSYIAGQQLACQNPVDWTTWSNIPCDPIEDPYISTNHAYSSSNSIVILYGNDLVKTFGSLTSGKWYVDFQVYIPSGKTGYFNLLAVFDEIISNWAMECYFNTSGIGSLNAGGNSAANFTWIENSWQQVRIVVDLDSDQAEFLYGSSMIYSWQWTLGANGGGSPLQLDAIDFYGAYLESEMYIDNFMIGDALCLSCVPPITPNNLITQVIYNPNPQVQLNWQDNSWNEEVFYILRKDGSLNEPGEFETIGNVAPDVIQYIDINVMTDSTYTYGIQAYNEYGYSDTSNFATITIDPVTYVSEIDEPLTYFLKQNYPNPFNPSTRIGYTLSEAGYLKLSVYNMLGEEVAVLVDREVEEGSHEVTFDASSLPSGAYFYKLQLQSRIEVKKMLLNK